MAQHIDKAAVLAEIEKLRKEWSFGYSAEAKYRVEIYKELIDFLNTLEVKEVDEVKIGETQIYLEDDGGKCGYYYKAGKFWEDKKLWKAVKDNQQEDINVESFLQQDNYWNIGSFLELAKEMQLVLKADYSFPIIIDEDNKLVDGAHRLVHAYLDGKTHIKGVIIRNYQWPEPDYDELKNVNHKE